MYSKATVKYIQSLGQKKNRDAEGVFVAEGPVVVSEMLQGKIFACKALYCTQSWFAVSQKLFNHVPAGSVYVVQDFELQKLSGLTTANAVVGVFKKRAVSASPDLQNKISLALDDIQDPGNLGTIIRTAHWFGIKHIVCGLQTADVYAPKVVQSTMASIGHVEVRYVDLPEFLSQTPLPVYCATLNGSPISILPNIAEGIIVIGNEGRGIQPGILGLGAKQIAIPGTAGAESLNASVAAAILMYHFCS